MTAIKPSSSSIERQLELTINAVARSMRKALRLADKLEPGSTGGLWKVVEHRAGMLQELLQAAGQFMQKGDPAEGTPEVEAEAQPAAPKVKSTEDHAQASQNKPRQVPKPNIVPTPRTDESTKINDAALPVQTRTQRVTQGNGWRYAA